MDTHPSSSGPTPEEAWRDALRREARRLVSDPEEAEDLVQECLLVLVSHGATLRDPARLLARCRVVLRNLLRQRRRRRWYSEVLGLDDLPEPSCDPWPAVELRLMLEEGLNQLPATQAQVTRRFYLGGQSIAEISRVQGRPEGTIKRWLHESREVLRMAVTPDEDKLPTACLYASDWSEAARQSVTAAVQAAGLSPMACPPPEGEFAPPEGVALVLLGEQVGARTGLELLLCLRAAPETRETPVLLFGPARHTAILAAWQAGADAYLTGPGAPDLPALIKQLATQAGVM